MKPIQSTQVGSNAERTRLHNRQVVLQCVRANQPVGRAQIARHCHLSTQAVSNIIADLDREGWLEEVGRYTQGRGLPAVLYALRSTGAGALGIEVRSDAVFGAMVDLTGKPLFTKRVALDSTTPQHVADIVQQLMHEAQSESQIMAERLLGAGIVMPGPFGRVGLSDAGQSTLDGWQDVDVHALFSDALEIPIVIEHDAIAAALSERITGVASELDTYAFIYFGTGIGLGVVVNGQVLRGAFGNSGELGHVIVERGGRRCACGNLGCLETYVSRFALRQVLAEQGLKGNTGDEIEALFIKQCPALLSWLEQALEPLAQTIGLVENIFDPESVIIGGAMPDVVLDYLIKRVSLHPGSVADRQHRTTPRIQRGASGRMSATLGGAAIILNEMFVPRIVASN